MSFVYTYPNAEVIRSALEHFAQDDQVTALRKYMTGKGHFVGDSTNVWYHDVVPSAWCSHTIKTRIWFQGENGERMVCQEAIKAYLDPTVGYRGHKTIYVECRAFIAYKMPRSKADRPLRHSHLALHGSEPSWSREVGHQYHFMSFPREIRELIYSFATTARGSNITPLTRMCLWKREFSTPTYRMNVLGSGYRGVQVVTPTIIPRQDNIGPYVELRNILRPMVDSTFLRASKQLYEEASYFLYSKNKISFNMLNTDRKCCPPTLDLQRNLFEPDPYKPFFGENWKAEIERGMSAAWRQQEFELPGWAYYDDFLHFLTIIGSRNAARIRSLEFCGSVKLHTCDPREERYRHCEDCIAESLCVYVPFVVKFCTGLQKLTLKIFEDPRSDPMTGRTAQDILEPKLRSEIKKITSLMKLEVIHAEDGQTVGYARETISEVLCDARKRALEKVRSCAEYERRELEMKALKELVRENNIHCGFCGEEHVWAECFNLCNFCGSYGHFRRTCPALSE